MMKVLTGLVAVALLVGACSPSSALPPRCVALDESGGSDFDAKIKTADHETKMLFNLHAVQFVRAKDAYDMAATQDEKDRAFEAFNDVCGQMQGIVDLIRSK